MVGALFLTWTQYYVNDALSNGNIVSLFVSVIVSLQYEDIKIQFLIVITNAL